MTCAAIIPNNQRSHFCIHWVSFNSEARTLRKLRNIFCSAEL